jgi:hypothetical protein
MAQVSWRADDGLVERVKRSAAASGRSLNEFVLDVATDPARAGTEAERVRERLRHAGLLEPPSPPASRRSRPTRAAVEAASCRAAKGTSLSKLVSEGR